MGVITCRDDPIFDAGIKKMIEEMVNLCITEYMNAIIFFNKNQGIDPLNSRAIERRKSIKDCEDFFLYDYEYMTDQDGKRAVERYRALAHERKTYVNRKWSRRSNERSF